MNKINCAVVVPTYNHGETLGEVLEGIVHYADAIIVVNDCSKDNTAELLVELSTTYSQITILTTSKHKGKGNAVKLGLLTARERGFEYAITIDSDGQSLPSEIPHFMQECERTPHTLLVGNRNISTKSIFESKAIAHKFSNFWFHLETDIHLQDAQSSYRLYPLNLMGDMKYYTSGYEFELESLVFPAWKGVPMRNILIEVNHSALHKRVSNFNPIYDYTKILILNIVLVVVTFLWIWPVRFFKSLSKENIKKFVQENITHSPASNFKLTLSITFGIFMGLTPVWGYQMIITGVVAHFCKLNKVLSLAASNLSLPFIIPYVLYGGCITGAYLLHRSTDIALGDISFKYITHIFGQYLLGSIVFAMVCSLILGTFTYLIFHLIRKPVQSSQ